MREVHPNSLKNLEKGRFKKGQSGNPQGRPPRELCITSITRDQLGEPCPKDPSRTWARYLSDKWLELACENVHAFKELMERLEGRVVFPIETEPTPIITRIIAWCHADTDSEEIEGRPEIDTGGVCQGSESQWN